MKLSKLRASFKLACSVPQTPKGASFELAFSSRREGAHQNTEFETCSLPTYIL